MSLKIEESPQLVASSPKLLRSPKIVEYKAWKF